MSDLQICRATGKRSHRSIQAAKIQAKFFARSLAHRHELSQDMYAYLCNRCDSWHLTRTSTWNGKESEQVYVAAPAEIQRWGWS